ncbi:hypothetical protein [Bacillus fonticola]|uniref:hypothetical protein n=1 Tax=Bacillus fonticola TaxID=2728853 RepID=UPI0014750377|nr:hypothetical protein [Bacillus fonticola]
MIEKQIIDQRVRNIVDKYPEWFEDLSDDDRKISRAFLLLGVSSELDIEVTEAITLITDGRHDAAIDAIQFNMTSLLHSFKLSIRES